MNDIEEPSMWDYAIGVIVAALCLVALAAVAIAVVEALT